MLKLIERIKKECHEFENNLVTTSSPQEVCNKAYEICWENEICEFICNENLTEEQESCLLKVDGNLLNILYGEWLKSPYDAVSDLEYIIRVFAWQKAIRNETEK